MYVLYILCSKVQLFELLLQDLQKSLFATNLFSIQIANLRRDSPRQTFFASKHKIVQKTQKWNKFSYYYSKIRDFLEKITKTGKNCAFFARPLQSVTVLQVCAGGARKLCYFKLKSLKAFFALFGRSVELLGLHICVLVHIDIKQCGS